MIAGQHVRQALRVCGGNLRFSHHESVPVINKQTKKIVKTIKKSFYLCEKCGDLVCVIFMPRYEEYKNRR